MNHIVSLKRSNRWRHVHFYKQQHECAHIKKKTRDACIGSFFTVVHDSVSYIFILCIITIYTKVSGVWNFI